MRTISIGVEPSTGSCPAGSLARQAAHSKAFSKVLDTPNMR